MTNGAPNGANGRSPHQGEPQVLQRLVGALPLRLKPNLASLWLLATRGEKSEASHQRRKFAGGGEACLC